MAHSQSLGIDTPDMIWHQDVKVLQQVLKAALAANGSGDANKVNIVNIGQIVVGNKIAGGQNGKPLSPSALLEAVLEHLPEPRMQGLLDMAIQLAVERHKTQRQAAGWLGISERSIRDKIKRALPERTR